MYYTNCKIEGREGGREKGSKLQNMEGRTYYTNCKYEGREGGRK